MEAHAHTVYVLNELSNTHLQCMYISTAHVSITSAHYSIPVQVKHCESFHCQVWTPASYQQPPRLWGGPLQDWVQRILECLGPSLHRRLQKGWSASQRIWSRAARQHTDCKNTDVGTILHVVQRSFTCAYEHLKYDHGMYCFTIMLLGVKKRLSVKSRLFVLDIELKLWRNFSLKRWEFGSKALFQHHIFITHKTSCFVAMEITQQTSFGRYLNGHGITRYNVYSYVVRGKGIEANGVQLT